MKRSKLFVILIVILATRSVFANPIVSFPSVYGISGSIFSWVFVAPTALLVEYLVVGYFLRKWVKLREVLPAFIFINLITFPITQLLGLFLLWFAEYIPLLFEPYMYRKYLEKRGIEVIGLGKRIVAANLISFVVGIVLVAQVPPNHNSHESAYMTETKANISTLYSAIALYEMHTGAYPDPDVGLVSLIENPGIEKWDGPYLYKAVLPKDAWGNAFIYRVENNIPILISLGADGIARTDDDIKVRF